MTDFEKLLEKGILLYEENAECSGQEEDIEIYEQMMEEVDELKEFQAQLQYLL